MKTLARVVMALVTVAAAGAMVLLFLGYSPVELKHIGDPRNVLDEGGTEVRIPLPQGPAERRLPAVPVTSDGEYAFIFSDATGPVRYDPCRPIKWVLSPAGMPAFAEPLVFAAVNEVQERTGLEFDYEGYTDERATFDRRLLDDDDADDFAPLIIGWSTAAEEPELAGTVSGIGGSSAVPGAYGDQRYLRGGVVIMDADDLVSFLATSKDSLLVQAVIMHELGHVVGLAHVDDSNQLMYPSNHSRTAWGEGDLAGLAIAGDGPCEQV